MPHLPLDPLQQGSGYPEMNEFVERLVIIFYLCVCVPA